MIGMRASLVIVGCLGISCAIAATQDFARGRIIQITSEGSVHRVTLPQDVYEWVVRPDLGDLMVYNADQEEVPHTLRRSSAAEEFTAWSNLPVFALPAHPENQETASSVNIELGEGGAVVAVRGGTGMANDNPQVLIDASTVGGAIDQLKVQWPMGDGSFIGKFRVAASDDLQGWRTMNPAATIAVLSAVETNGKQIVLDTIELESVRHKYLRVIQIEGPRPLSIDAASVRSRQLERPVRHSKMLSVSTGAPNSTLGSGSGSGNGFEFDIGGHLPLDRVAVRLAGSSYLVNAHLFSRSVLPDR